MLAGQAATESVPGGFGRQPVAVIAEAVTSHTESEAPSTKRLEVFHHDRRACVIANWRLFEHPGRQGQAFDAVAEW